MYLFNFILKIVYDLCYFYVCIVFLSSKKSLKDIIYKNSDDDADNLKTLILLNSINKNQKPGKFTWSHYKITLSGFNLTVKFASS